MWDILITTLRLMIDDYVATYRYDDARLKKVLCICAQQLKGEIEFTYVVDVVNSTITPESTEDLFVNLVTLKAACFIDNAIANTYVRQGIKVSDNKSLVDTIDRARQQIALLDKGWCGAFQKAKEEYILGSLNPGLAIVSPFRQSSTHFEGLFSRA